MLATEDPVTRRTPNAWQGVRVWRYGDVLWVKWGWPSAKSSALMDRNSIGFRKVFVPPIAIQQIHNIGNHITSFVK